MSVRSLGLGSALRYAAVAPRAGRNQLAFALPKRLVQTQSFKPSVAVDVLNAQRLKRPSSPHFTIYQPQITWIGSIFHRITGSALSVLLYGFSIVYIAAPAVGLPFTSKDVVSLVSQLPTSVKYACKTILALPFTFHFYNGIRHLAWDAIKFMNVKGAYSSFYAVSGATVATTAALVVM